MYPNQEMLVGLFDSGDFGLAKPSSAVEGTSAEFGGSIYYLVMYMYMINIHSYK